MDKNVSLAKQLFFGEIATGNLFPYKNIDKQEKETLNLVIESIDKFMSTKLEDFKKYDIEGYQPEEYLNSLKELGLFSVIIPEEYEGLGLSAAAYSRIMQATSKYDASTALTIGAHSSIGMKGLLLFGNESQKKKYLPKLASGEMIAAFCLTEPGAGSDAASVKTSATKNTDGTWTLNGEKLWITNAPFAGFFTVFAKTDSKDAGKMSAFLVERTWQGVSTGAKEDKMGIRASATSSVIFQNVKIPAENLLGEEGKGFKIAMQILNNGRTGLGGGCVGGIKACIELATKQAKDRKQFGKSISEYLLIKEKIAQMTIDCFVVESVVNLIGQYIDADLDDYSIEAAISKIIASEAFWKASNEALQIAGGNGFMKEYPYERMVRDGRINLIFEGTNEILRLYIALSGCRELGESLTERLDTVKNSFNDPIKGFGVLKKEVSRRLMFATHIGEQKLHVHSSLQSYADILQNYVHRFSSSCDSLVRKNGKKIIGKQLQSKRIADSIIDLFSALATLSRVNSLILEKGLENCTQEINILHTFVMQIRRRVTQNLRRLEENEDLKIENIADFILENGYNWDVI